MNGTMALLGAGFLLAPVGIPGSASQPSAVEAGGTFRCTVWALNQDTSRRAASARVRLAGDSFYGSPRQAAVRGPWVEVEGGFLGPGESGQFEVEVPVPARVPQVLSLEIRSSPGLFWSTPLESRYAYADSALVPPERRDPRRDGVPFRIVAGGRARFDQGGTGLPPADGVRAGVVRTAAEWDDLRAWLGIVSPDSWGLPPPLLGGQRPDFASGAPPDPAFGTLLAFRTPDLDTCQDDQRRLWVRSVDRRPDGALTCRFSFRSRRIPGGVRPCPLFILPGQWLLVAIPKTDAQIVFQRVP